MTLSRLQRNIFRCLINKIVLISSGQPSLNPRLVKEADALAESDYDVTVIYQYWNHWGTEMDKLLLPAKKWKAVRVGGSPTQNKALYFVTRLQYKAAKTLLKWFGFKALLAERAAGRCTFILLKEALQRPADLYIAHNLAALPAAVLAAQKNKSKCGFDAEDFHRQEATDDVNSIDFKLITSIENKFIPNLNYLSVASPLIGAAYNQIYHHEPTCILNVFPKLSNRENTSLNKPLKLVWFSQYIGFGRGLELVFEALNELAELNFELHLIGFLSTKMADFIQNNAGLKSVISKIIIHKPLPPDQLISYISQFDIGLATETGQPLNRDICLSNKIFSYIQAGLSVLASNTTAQKQLLSAHPEIGKIYDKNSITSLTAALNSFYVDDELLLSCKKNAFVLGQTTLNWETESIKFLSLVEATLAD